jgi:MFS family permease
VLVGPYLLAGAGLLLATAVLVGGLRDGRAGQSGGRDNRSVRLGQEGLAGLVVLGLANLVMVAVMTMAPVHLHHAGAGLGAIGLVISAHIAGMFAPSPLSGWLTGRFGAHWVARLAGATLATACLLAAAAGSATSVLGFALVLLGVGWNLALVSGSLLLTAGVPSRARPRREGWGEVSMGFAAALGGAASGIVATAGGYPLLAATTAVVALALVPLLTWLGRRPRPDLEYVARRMLERNIGDYAEAATGRRAE